MSQGHRFLREHWLLLSKFFSLFIKYNEHLTFSFLKILSSLVQRFFLILQLKEDKKEEKDLVFSCHAFILFIHSHIYLWNSVYGSLAAVMYKTDIVLADCVITGEVGAKGVCTQTETQIHTHTYMSQVGLRSNTMRTRDGKKK